MICKCSDYATISVPNRFVFIVRTIMDQLEKSSESENSILEMSRRRFDGKKFTFVVNNMQIVAKPGGFRFDVSLLFFMFSLVFRHWIFCGTMLNNG